jgi:cytidylate kinase
MAIVTISRGTKSGGEALARCLAGRLGCSTLGREVAQEAATQLGVPVRDLEERLEEKPGILGRSNLLTRLYVAAVQNALVEDAASGSLVYHGLAGAHLLRGVPAVLSVRLISPLQVRVRTLVETEEMDEASAEAYIKDVDDARARWVRAMYGLDIADPAQYDLVVNLERFSIPEVCEVLTSLLARPEFQMTSERLADLHDFRVQCQVRLALLEDLGTQTLDLEASVRRGSVEVTGQAPLLRDGDVGARISQIVSEVPGVDEVHLRLEWFDPYP